MTSPDSFTVRADGSPFWTRRIAATNGFDALYAAQEREDGVIDSVLALALPEAMTQSELTEGQIQLRARTDSGLEPASEHTHDDQQPTVLWIRRSHLPPVDVITVDAPQLGIAQQFELPKHLPREHRLTDTLTTSGVLEFHGYGFTRFTRDFANAPLPWPTAWLRVASDVPRQRTFLNAYGDSIDCFVAYQAEELTVSVLQLGDTTW